MSDYAELRRLLDESARPTVQALDGGGSDE